MRVGKGKGYNRACAAMAMPSRAILACKQKNRAFVKILMLEKRNSRNFSPLIDFDFTY